MTTRNKAKTAAAVAAVAAIAAEPKPTYKSRTIWFNVLAGLGEVIMAVSAGIPANILPWIMGAHAAINVGLRMITTQPVTMPEMPGLPDEHEP